MEPEEGQTERKVMTRSTYEAVADMVGEGCPNWRDLDEYDVVEDKPEPPTKAFVAC